MFLVVAATEIELRPFLAKAGKPDGRWEPFTSGVGPLETAVRLGRRIAQAERPITGLLMFGIGGAYPVIGAGEGPGLLDICVAEREVMGDFGIDLGERFEYFSGELAGPAEYPLCTRQTSALSAALDQQGLSYHRGTFLTVNSVSGTTARGMRLAGAWQGLCENMEGGAAARLCLEYAVPMAEFRVVSNMVVDRNTKDWKVREACEHAGELAASLLGDLL